MVPELAELPPYSSLHPSGASFHGPSAPSTHRLAPQAPRSNTLHMTSSHPSMRRGVLPDIVEKLSRAPAPDDPEVLHAVHMGYSISGGVLSDYSECAARRPLETVWGLAEMEARLRNSDFGDRSVFQAHGS